MKKKSKKKKKKKQQACVLSCKAFIDFFRLKFHGYTNININHGHRVSEGPGIKILIYKFVMNTRDMAFGRNIKS